MISPTATAVRQPLRAAVCFTVLVASVVAAFVWMGSPARAGGPTATMEPNSGLGDQQRTTIRGSGFDPNTPIQVLECNGTLKAPPQDARSCEGLSLDTSGYTDGQGNYVDSPTDHVGNTKGYLVLMLPDSLADLVGIHCGHPNDPPCVAYVGEDHNDFHKKHVFIPLAFRGQHGGGHSDGSWVLILVLLVMLVTGAAAVLWRRSRSARV